MKLPKKDKARLAVLINSLQVSHDMLHEQDSNRELWRDAIAETTIQLYKEFEIELPALSIYMKG